MPFQNTSVSIAIQHILSGRFALFDTVTGHIELGRDYELSRFFIY